MTQRPLLKFIAAILFMALAVVPAAAQSAQNKDKTERLGVPGPVVFEGQNYALASSAHPQPEYFLQEYLPAGQGLDSYTHMFLIEALTANVTPKDAAASQIAMLDQRKEKDPLVNHEANVNEATGEVMVDFLVSGSSNGKVVVEWNAYRYTPLKGDKPGVVLHGISRRAYGEDEAKKFLTSLKDWRSDAKGALTAFNAPAIKPQP
jgi:hypothetical protein